MTTEPKVTTRRIRDELLARREFIAFASLGLFAGVMTAAAGGRHLRATLVRRVTAERMGDAFGGFSDREKLILESFALSVVVGLTPALARRVIDVATRILESLPWELRRDFLAALWVFEFSPVVFGGGFARFSSLSLESRARVITRWTRPRGFPPGKGVLFGALREIVLLGYYSAPETWAAIGYSGPMVEAGRGPSPLDARYTELLAPGARES